MLRHQIERVSKEIAQLEEELGEFGRSKADAEEYIEVNHFKVPPNSIPIRCDVRSFDWKVSARKPKFK